MKLTTNILFLGVLAVVRTQAVSANSSKAIDIYEEYCVSCHAPGNIMVASPKLHKRTQWEQRLQKGYSSVLENALNGFNAMPPMGGCDTCSANDIEATLRYMAAPALESSGYNN